MSQPLVSVVMCVFNEEDYIEDTIDSILAQTLADFEFIIVNDGSTDRTLDLLETFGKKDKRIKLTSNPKNLGIAKSINIGVKKAKGKYVAIMDAGDLCYRTRLEKQIECLESREDVHLLGTQGRWIDKDGNIIGTWRLPLKVDGRALYRTGGAIHPSIMARRDIFDSIGLYDEDLVMSQEFDFYMRVLKNHLGMANLNEELICIRERGDGMTLRNLKTIQKNQLEIKIKYLPFFWDFWNIIFTARSFVGYIIPSFILIKLVKHLRKSRRITILMH